MACCCELQNTLDVEIGGSAGVLLQAKSVEVTANGTSVVAPDDGFDGLSGVEINTNVPKKINGVPEAPDGTSLVQLICSEYNIVTELDDDTTWESGKNINTLVSLFPNLAKVVWGARSHRGTLAKNLKGITELELPNLRTVSMVTGNALISNIGVEELTLHITSYENYVAGCVIGCTNLRKLTFDELESIRLTNDNDNRMIGNCSALEEVYAEKLGRVYVYRSTDENNNGFVSNCAALKRLCFGDVTSWAYRGIDRETGAPNLIDLRFKSVSCSLDLGYWNPTNVLANQDLLQQFLSNFRDYIALRLTDNGRGKTLTLSQAVRNAIHAAEDEYGIENIIITQKGWTISPAPN